MIDALGRPQSMLLVGGTSDIGLAIAKRLLQDRGARLVLAGRDLAALERARDTFRRTQPQLSVETASLEIRQLEGHKRTLDEVFDRGDVDVVVLAVGVLGDQSVLETDPSAAVTLAETNYLGPMSVTLNATNRLVAQGHGVIVILSSVAALRGRRSNYVYGSTKAGLDVFSRGLSDRLHGTGVRLITVRPGFVRTRMTAGLHPAPLAVSSGDVADAVARAVAGRGSVVWVPAAMRWVMAGLRVLPDSVFRRLDL